MISHSYLCDNIEFMMSCKDNEFDIGIVDPEYLDVNQPNQFMRAKGGMVNWKGAPTEIYFRELFRITKDQIIWGGNYFTEILNSNNVPYLRANNNWLIWNKKIAKGMNYSMYEKAWISRKCIAEIFTLSPVGKTKDWHSTSKPRELYQHVLNNYCKKWEYKSIFDSNQGSGTLREACFSLGFNYTGCEIDENYFDKCALDFERYTGGLFVNNCDIKNIKFEGL